VEQLIEKLEQHSGNMEHVVHSLLSVWEVFSSVIEMYTTYIGFERDRFFFL
jgi:hypothetical protein